MTTKKLIALLASIHASDDPVITAQRSLNELYEMRQMANCRQVRRAIRILSRYVHKQIKLQENLND